MKKCYLMVFCAVFLVSGCAGWKAERKVENNVFISSSRPKIAVNISPELDYIGKDEDSRYVNVNVTGEYYLFGEKNEDDQLQRGVLIQIHTIQNSSRWKWSSKLFPENEDNIISDQVEFNSKEYQHISKAIKDLFSKGHRISTNNYLCDCFARRFSGGYDLKMYIIYFEDVSFISPEYSFDQWKDKNSISKEQKLLFKEFLERSRTSFSVLAKIPVIDAVKVQSRELP